MLKPITKMYNSDNEWLTTLIPTDDETTPLFWADFGEQLDRWLLNRAGNIGVNDNINILLNVYKNYCET